MASTKEIQGRIKGVRDTMKITNAMYMISSAKLKKAKKDLDNTAPYFTMLQATMNKTLSHVSEVTNQYFDLRSEIPNDQRKCGYIVVTADKGLAGAYNHNILKIAMSEAEQHPETKLFVIGSVGRHAFAKQGMEVEANFEFTAQNPTLNKARMMAFQLVDMYLTGELDELSIIYTHMKSAMAVDAKVQQLLPLKMGDFEISESGLRDELAMYPSPEELFNHLVPDYLAGFIYGALIESFCSEQNARMMAMQSATDSAKDVLRDLSIAYNRARQGAITQEITEVAAGARSHKKKS